MRAEQKSTSETLCKGHRTVAENGNNIMENKEPSKKMEKTDNRMKMIEGYGD